MKYFLLPVILFFPLFILADEAPVQPVQGGNVKPVANGDIQMKKETIVIHLRQDDYSVDVTYTFINHGEKQKVTMGFPNETSSIYTSAIENFTATDGKLPLTIYKKFDSGNPEEDYLPKKFWECSDVPFEKAETKIITNRYTQKYETDYNSAIRKMRYVLTTGSYWKDKIDSIRIIVFADLPENEFRKRTAYFLSDEPEIYGEVQFLPGKFIRKGNVYEKILTDIEPDADIEITFPCKLVLLASSSSVLEPEGIKYIPANSCDNDLHTAWVEGIAGPGIGETLQLDISPSWAGGKLGGYYLIEKIGIINGYAKNQTVFKSNNRVKKVLLTLEFYNEEAGFSSESMEFTLEDKMELQYIIFDAPKKISVLTIKILDVYKGDKYDDTCISEVLIVPSSN